MMIRRPSRSTHFFFNDTATTEIYALSLHDALPISTLPGGEYIRERYDDGKRDMTRPPVPDPLGVPLYDNPTHLEIKRSEEHTSELQSRQYLVCRLLLEKKTLITIILSYA